MPTITDFSRKTIDYLGDDGASYRVSQRTVVQAACTNVISTTSGPGRPAGWKLRHVWAVTPATGAVTNRKKCVIGSPTNTIFADGTAPANMDGVAWRVEGRIGEKRTTR